MQTGNQNIRQKEKDSLEWTQDHSGIKGNKKPEEMIKMGALDYKRKPPRMSIIYEYGHDIAKDTKIDGMQG